MYRRLACGAILTHVRHDSGRDNLGSLVEVSGGEDNVGRFAAELERDFLQIGLGSGFHDLAPSDGASGEGYLVDLHVLRERRTTDWSGRRETVQHSRRESKPMRGSSVTAGAIAWDEGGAYPASTSSSQSFYCSQMRVQ